MVQSNSNTTLCLRSKTHSKSFATKQSGWPFAWGAISYQRSMADITDVTETVIELSFFSTQRFISTQTDKHKTWSQLSKVLCHKASIDTEWHRPSQNNDSLLHREGRANVQMTVIKIDLFMVKERGICYWFNSILRLNKQHVHIVRCQMILHMAWCIKWNR